LLKPEAGGRRLRQHGRSEYHFLIAYEDGEVIGIVNGRTYAGVAHVSFLRKEYRGKRVGESLLDRFIEEARKGCLEGLALHVSKAFTSHKTLH